MHLENAKRQLGMFAAMGGMLVEQRRLVTMVEELSKQQLSSVVSVCVQQSLFLFVLLMI